MHNFKPGQKIRLIDCPLDSMPLGTIVEVCEQSAESSRRSVCFRENGRVTWRPAEYFELVSEGPVRTETVTKRRIVPGVYGRLSVGQVVNVPDCNNPDEPPQVRVDLELIGGSGLTATEIDDLAMVASQLAEALRDA